jgi:hypothetical protein
VQDYRERLNDGVGVTNLIQRRGNKSVTVYYLQYTPDNPIGGTTNARIRTRTKERVEAVMGGTATVATNAGPLFEVSETKKKKGLKPRSVTLARISQTTGTQLATLDVPVLTAARWNEINLGQSFTINGQTWAVVRKNAEEVGS